MSVDAVEAAWLAVNATAILLTVVALIDAWRDRTAVDLRNGAARQVVANGNVRREVVRLGIQAALLSLVVPGLFIDRPTPLNFFVVVLMAVPVLLLLNTALDLRDRKRLAGLIRLLLATDSARATEAAERTADATERIADVTEAGQT